MTYDAIILGAGAMGSAAALSLARRGWRVLALERHGIAHDRGSSHGETRIIRKAYFEHPDYVPLLHRTYALWDRLSREAGQELFHRCGLLLAGYPRHTLLTGVRRAASEHDLYIPTVPRNDWPRRFPGFGFDPAMETLFEADAGYLLVEACVRAQVEQARRLGATIRESEEAVQWRTDEDLVRVSTAKNEYRSAKLVVCAGAWTGRILADLGLPLTVRRKVQLWFPTTSPAHLREASCPVFAFQTHDGFFYGFPSLDGKTMKIAEHTGEQAVAEPEELDRMLHQADVERVAAFTLEHVPGVQPRPVRHSACMYTMTPDEHFIIDVHPRHANVVFAAGFSGHGFKFAPVIGEALADLAATGATALPMSFLRWGRFC